MIEYISGSVFDQLCQAHYKLIPHCCNDIGLMGSGVAKVISDKFPEVKTKYLKMDHVLGKVGLVKCGDNIIVANMIAQSGIMKKFMAGKAVGSNGAPPINYVALQSCIDYITKLIQKIDCEIHCPKFGSYRAGGDWSVIEKMIEESWSKYTVVKVCVI